MNIPIVSHSLITGARLPITDADVRALGNDPVIHIGGTNARVVRRLDPSEPMDQREIARMAAIKLGASLSTAAEVAFYLEEAREDMLHVWLLLGNREWIRVHAPTRDQATQALIAAVWGTS